jgi:5-methyltetrahydrofolate--homocysteine methyltransferase
MGGYPMSAEIIEKIRKSIIEGKPTDIINYTKVALTEGLSAKVILEEGLMPGIRRVGELFSEGEYYLPELMVAGKAMETALKELEPFLGEEKGSSHTGKFLIGTVKGDIHDIGKKIVVMMLKGNGWDVTDLGVDLPPEKVCDAIKTGNYDVFGMSTLLTVTMPAARDTIEAIKKAGLRDRIKIMIGGAPVTEEFAEKIGADAYGKDAYEAVTKAQLLVTQK